MADVHLKREGIHMHVDDCMDIIKLLSHVVYSVHVYVPYSGHTVDGQTIQKLDNFNLRAAPQISKLFSFPRVETGGEKST